MISMRQAAYNWQEANSRCAHERVQVIISTGEHVADLCTKCDQQLIPRPAPPKGPGSTAYQRNSRDGGGNDD